MEFIRSKIIYQTVYINTCIITNIADKLQTQGEMIRDELPIVLEEDQAVCHRESTDIVDGGENASLPEQAPSLTLSKVKLIKKLEFGR